MQFVIGDLIGPLQNYAVKGRSIQDNSHLVGKILKGLEDDTEAALINLDQSKAFDRVVVPQIDQHIITQTAGSCVG